MKEFLAELSISKFFNSNTVQIVINDESSGCHVLEMEITLEAFAKALFSQGDMAGTAKVYLDAPIGKVIETKAEVVPPRNMLTGNCGQQLPKPSLPLMKLTDGRRARMIFGILTNGAAMTLLKWPFSDTLTGKERLEAMKRTIPNLRQAKTLEMLIGGDDNRRIRRDQHLGVSEIAIRDNETEKVILKVMLPTLTSLEKLGWIVKSSATDTPAFYDITYAGRLALARFYNRERGMTLALAQLRTTGVGDGYVIKDGFDAVCCNCHAQYTFKNAKIVGTENWQQFCAPGCEALAPKV